MRCVKWRSPASSDIALDNSPMIGNVGLIG